MDKDAHGGVLELGVKVENTGVCCCLDMGKFFSAWTHHYTHCHNEISVRKATFGSDPSGVR